MKRTGALLVLPQNKKWVLLLLKGLHKQNWINWPLSWCKWRQIIFRSKMVNLARIIFFRKSISIFLIYLMSYCILYAKWAIPEKKGLRIYFLQYIYLPQTGTFFWKICILHCCLPIAQPYHVRFKVKEYKQIWYLLWAATVDRWSNLNLKKIWKFEMFHISFVYRSNNREIFWKFHIYYYFL